jgi:hypothetical protein
VLLDAHLSSRARANCSQKFLNQLSSRPGVQKAKKKNEIDIFPFFHRPFLTSFQSFRIEIKDKTKETKKIKKQEDHV